MPANPEFGFGKFVPGFDFLQNLAKGAAQTVPQMPHLSSWVAPTLSVEELDKRIAEMKAVQFWLEQNGKALGATIQALEVQKMTLSTLEGMNLRMTDLADSLKLQPEAEGSAKPAADAKPSSPAKGGARASATGKPGAEGAAAVDPLQWWSSLTQQFQQIAASAMKDVAQGAGADAARMTTQAAEGAMKAASGMMQAAGAAAAPAPAAKPARKAAGASTGRAGKAGKAPARKTGGRKTAAGG